MDNQSDTVDEHVSDFEKNVVAPALLGADAGECLTAEELIAAAHAQPTAGGEGISPALKHVSVCRSCRSRLKELKRGAQSAAEVDQPRGTPGIVFPPIPQTSSTPQPVIPIGSKTSPFAAAPPVFKAAAQQPAVQTRQVASPQPVLRMASSAAPSPAPVAKPVATQQAVQAPRQGLKLSTGAIRGLAAAAAILFLWFAGTRFIGSARGGYSSNTGNVDIHSTNGGSGGSGNLAGSQLSNPASLTMQPATVLSDGGVQLSWGAIAEAVTYTIDVREDGANAASVFTQDAVTAQAYVPADRLLAKKQYRWSVSAKSATGKTLTQGTGYFSTR